MKNDHKREPGIPLEVLQGLAPKPGSVIEAKTFQAVTFYDKEQKRQIIVLYALGVDGIVREYVNQRWNAYPIYRESDH
jgi:hypothetical protein